MREHNGYLGPLFAGWCLALWLVVFAHTVGAETEDEILPAEVAGTQSESTIQTSPVMVDGLTLFKVRGATAYPSERRAAVIAEQIVHISNNPDFDPQQLRVVAENKMSVIYAGDLRLMPVLDADAVLEGEGIERELLAKTYLDRIQEAVEHYREQRSPDYLINSTVTVLLAFGLLAMSLFALRWLFRKLLGAIKRYARCRMEDLQARTFNLVRAQQLWGLVESSLVLLKWMVVLVSVDLFLSFALGLFPWTRSISHSLLDALYFPLKSMFTGIGDALPGLVFLAVLIVVIRYLLSLLKLYFAGVAEGSIEAKGFESEWALPTYRLLRLPIIAFGLVAAFPYIPGSSSDAFKGLSVLFGLLVSLGSPSIIRNFIAGYALLYQRSFKIGDSIQVGEHSGDVDSKGPFAIYLRTIRNEVVVVPNSEVLNGSIINYSRLNTDTGLIITTTVNIGYETPWRQVEAMLMMAADRTLGLSKETEPFVL